jgi:pimeloyl-ACP methyl ester carboxylesterase
MKPVKHKWRFLALFCFVGIITVYGIFPIGRAIVVSYPQRTPLMGTPGDVGLVYEDVTFTTSTDVQLHGWRIASQNGATILIIHPYKGNRSYYLEQAAFLAEHGYGVLLFDLTAHGESEGRRLTLDGTDVLAAVSYLKSRSDTKSEKIGAWGFSLGGVVSLQAAAQNDDISVVVADGPFPVVAAEDMPAPETLEDWFWLPFDVVQRLALQIFSVSPAQSTSQALSQIAPRPILLISGIQNRGERRVMQHYGNIAGENVFLWEVAGANHIESWSIARETYETNALQLFNETLVNTNQ